MNSWTDWKEFLADRMYSTPALQEFLNPELSLYIKEKPVRITEEHLQMITVIGRHIKQGKNLGLFFPAPDYRDMIVTTVYLKLLADSMFSQWSLPGTWLNKNRIKQSDLILLGNLPRLKSILGTETKIYQKNFSEFCPVFYPRRVTVRNPDIFPGVEAERGKTKIFLLEKGLSRFSQYQDQIFPFAIFIDGASDLVFQEKIRSQVQELQLFYPEVPIVLIAPLGNKSLLLELRKWNFSTWLHRAGDFFDSNQKSFFLPLLSVLPDSLSSAPTRMEKAGKILQEGIQVVIKKIQDESLQNYLLPIAEVLTKGKKESSGKEEEILKIARSVYNTLSSLCVPVKIYEDIASGMTGWGEYRTKTLHFRLEQLKILPAHFGDLENSRLFLQEKLSQLCSLLSKNSCITGKQSVFLETARSLKREDFLTYVVCPNKTVMESVRVVLAKEEIETLGENCNLRLATYSQAWKETEWEENIEIIILLGYPDMSTGIFFSGVARKVILFAYDWEMITIQEKLQFIGWDTQATSALQGDKIGLSSCSGSSPFLDKGIVSQEDWAWEIKEENIEGTGVYPEEREKVPRFVLEEKDWISEWMKEHLESEKEEKFSPVLRETQERVILTLSDDEEEIYLSPEVKVAVLSTSADEVEGVLLARELQEGMIVLLNRTSPNRELFLSLYERLGENPKYQMANALAQLWRDAVNQVGILFDFHPQEALKELKKEGVGVNTAASVDNWFKQKLLGPQDKKSILAVAKISGRTDLEQNASLVFQAIQQMRTWRSILGKKLAEYVRAGESLNKDHWIDQDLQLSGTDLEEITRIGTILQLKHYPAKKKEKL